MKMAHYYRGIQQKQNCLPGQLARSNRGPPSGPWALILRLLNDSTITCRYMIIENYKGKASYNI